MPIQKSQRDLRDQGEGFPPDDDPRFVRALLDAWHEDYVARGEDNKPMAHEGVLFRASDAGGCARALGYKVARRLHAQDPEAEVPDAGDGPSNPPSTADSFRMGIGSMVHEQVLPFLSKAYPGAEFEVEILRPAEPGISMHADIIVTWLQEIELNSGQGDAEASVREMKTLVEVKTINGMGFKRAAFGFNGPPEGPRRTAVVQGALAAIEKGCNELVILYLALEAASVAVAKKHGLDDYGRVAAQWTFEEDELIDAARTEQKRMVAVELMVRGGKFPPRSIPDGDLPPGHRIVNPSQGAWEVKGEDGSVVTLGTTWWCGYCWDRDRCISDGPT